MCNIRLMFTRHKPMKQWLQYAIEASSHYNIMPEICFFLFIHLAFVQSGWHLLVDYYYDKNRFFSHRLFLSLLRLLHFLSIILDDGTHSSQKNACKIKINPSQLNQ